MRVWDEMALLNISEKLKFIYITKFLFRGKGGDFHFNTNHELFSVPTDKSQRKLTDGKILLKFNNFDTFGKTRIE